MNLARSNQSQSLNLRNRPAIDLGYLVGRARHIHAAGHTLIRLRERHQRPRTIWPLIGRLIRQDFPR